MTTPNAHAHQAFYAAMPAMLEHRGMWDGHYTHIDSELNILDHHASRVECVFPEDGPHEYVQRNHFTWPDGREMRVELPGVFRDGRLWFDTPTFHGSAWESHEGIILLDLDRRDEPGTRFREIILLGVGGAHRSRTWHWFRDGKLVKRTLCEERRV